MRKMSPCAAQDSSAAASEWRHFKRRCCLLHCPSCGHNVAQDERIRGGGRVRAAALRRATQAWALIDGTPGTSERRASAVCGHCAV